MHDEAEPIDVEGMPELEQLAEEVCATNQPRSLRRHGREIARVVPVTAGRGHDLPPRREPTQEDIDAFLGAAGGWKDFDLDGFLEYIYEARARGSKPPIEL